MNTFNKLKEQIKKLRDELPNEVTEHQLVEAGVFENFNDVKDLYVHGFWPGDMYDNERQLVYHIRDVIAWLNFIFEEHGIVHPINVAKLEKFGNKIKESETQE